MFYSFQNQSFIVYKYKFVPKYFIISDGILYRIVFLMSLSDCFLPVYKKYSGFLVSELVFCNATEFSSSNSFLVDYLGFSTYKIMPSVKRGSFTSSFPSWVFCFLFLLHCPG